MYRYAELVRHGPHLPPAVEQFKNHFFILNFFPRMVIYVFQHSILSVLLLSSLVN